MRPTLPRQRPRPTGAGAPPPPRRLRNGLRLLRAAAWVVTVAGWAPVMSILVCAVLARLSHCEVTEAAVQPCPVAGFRLGALLYRLGVFGWTFLASWPMALAAGPLWLLVALVAARLNRGHGVSRRRPR